MLNTRYNTGESTLTRSDCVANPGNSEERRDTERFCMSSLARGLQALDRPADRKTSGACPAYRRRWQNELGVEKPNASHVLHRRWSRARICRAQDEDAPLPADRQGRQAVRARTGPAASLAGRDRRLQGGLASGRCCRKLVRRNRRMRPPGGAGRPTGSGISTRSTPALHRCKRRPPDRLCCHRCIATALGKVLSGLRRRRRNRRRARPPTPPKTHHLAGGAGSTRSPAPVGSGYAVDDEEFAPGIRCVARADHAMTPDGGAIAALGDLGPHRSRMGRRPDR